MITILLNDETFKLNNFDELIKFLNSALYYCEELYLIEPLTNESIEYSGLNSSDIEDYLADALMYESEPLNFVQVYE